MCAHLSLDSFRLLIKSGYHDPRAGCNEEAQRQLNVARSNVASVALRFVESGISSVIDDVVFPNWEPAGLDRWRRAFEPFEIDCVAIIPQWEVILDRNSARLSVDKIPVEMLRQIYDDMSGMICQDGPMVRTSRSWTARLSARPGRFPRSRACFLLERQGNPPPNSLLTGREDPIPSAYGRSL